MKTDGKPVEMADLGLKLGEIKDLVEGVQKFLAPLADPADDELAKPVDSGE
jgi:hypothetical protein